jgi:dipeptidyl aminopeptidase/acylaminoacyl peptidase
VSAIGSPPATSVRRPRFALVSDATRVGIQSRGRWPEVIDGWSSGGGSRRSSNVTHAAKLRGKLLLTVGELDRNVDPASTMQVANALLAADKDFEVVVVPGGGHGVGESPALVRRRQDFFVRHLHGVEPRAR